MLIRNTNFGTVNVTFCLLLIAYSAKHILLLARTFKNGAQHECTLSLKVKNGYHDDNAGR